MFADAIPWLMTAVIAVAGLGSLISVWLLTSR
jgi:hypothetical protein